MAASFSHFVPAATKFSRCSSDKKMFPLFFISLSRSLSPTFSFCLSFSCSMVKKLGKIKKPGHYRPSEKNFEAGFFLLLNVTSNNQETHFRVYKSTCDLRKLAMRYPSFVAIQSSLMWFPTHSMWGSSDLGISNTPIRHTKGVITWPYYKKKRKRKKKALLMTAERNCQALISSHWGGYAKIFWVSILEAIKFNWNCGINC